MILYRKTGQLGAEPVARLEPRVSPGEALRAVGIRGQSTELLQFGNGSFGVNTHGSRTLEIHGLALQQSAAAALTHKLSISHLYPPAHGDDRRSAFDLHTFETVVVAVGMLRGRREDTPVIGIVDHQIRISSRSDRSLMRKQAEQLLCPPAG